MHIRDTFREWPGHFFEQSIRALLCMLLLALLGTIAAGVARTFADLWHSLHTLFHGESLEHGFKWILVDVLTVLAIVEVYRTAMTYFSEGRVKVTYIIDTVLVAVLTEVMAFWYREIETTRMVLVMALVLVLMFVRIMAIRYSPRRRELSEGL